MKITGSQESIIQLDLDEEDEEISPDQRRRYSVSPMPQMQRSSESQVSMLTLCRYELFNKFRKLIFRHPDAQRPTHKLMIHPLLNYHPSELYSFINHAASVAR